MSNFNELGMGLGNLPRLSSALTRSISAENPTGEKGSSRMAERIPMVRPGSWALAGSPARVYTLNRMKLAF